MPNARITVQTKRRGGSIMARVTGLGGVFFRTQDSERLRTWYRDQFGLEWNEHGVVAFGWRDQESPERAGQTLLSPFPADTDYFGPSGSSFMLNFRVDDLDGFLDRLRQSGIQIDKPVEEYEYGRFAWVTDSDGRRIELWEPHQGRRAVRDVGRPINHRCGKTLGQRDRARNPSAARRRTPAGTPPQQPAIALPAEAAFTQEFRHVVSGHESPLGLGEVLPQLLDFDGDDEGVGHHTAPGRRSAEDSCGSIVGPVRVRLARCYATERDAAGDQRRSTLAAVRLPPHVS